MRTLCLLLSAIAIGCGLNADEPVVYMAGASEKTEVNESPLIGFWAYDEPVVSCSRYVVFNRSTLFVFMRLCSLSDTDYGVEVVGGTYTFTDDRVTMTAQRSTCASTRNTPGTLAYDVSWAGRDLTLELDNGVRSTVYEYIGDPDEDDDSSDVSDANTTSTRGCFDDDDVFTPRAFLPV